jgi:hypothetical protein
MSRLTTLNASIGNLRREIERDRLRVDDRQQELDDAIAEHARLTNQLRGLGNDNEYEIGAILTFDKYFTHDGIQYGPYTYAAVKTAIHGNSQYRYMGSTAWFTSGPKAPGPYTWEQMLAFLSEGVHEVWLADTAKRIWVAR